MRFLRIVAGFFSVNFCTHENILGTLPVVRFSVLQRPKTLLKVGFVKPIFQKNISVV